MLDPSSPPQGAGPSAGTRRYSRRRLLGCGASAMALAGLSGLARAVTNYKGLDVIVVGAGLSGLHAACLLREQGLNVLTLEGRNRIGGRVYTLMDVPGRPEAGGEWMGANYARMIDTARRLGLEMLGPDEVSDIREYGATESGANTSSPRTGRIIRSTRRRGTTGRFRQTACYLRCRTRTTLSRASPWMLGSGRNSPGSIFPKRNI